MRSLNLPTYSFKIKSEDNKNFIFDAFRKKFIVLTPEEWVRQNFAHFLVNEKKFPAGRIVIEKSLRYNRLLKRCDILVYDAESNPTLMVECKASSVKIDRKVFDQLAVYNLSFKVPYLVVTNGMDHYCAKINFSDRKVEFMEYIPSYTDL